MQQIQKFKDRIRIGPEGWVANENFDAAKQVINRTKELSLEVTESEADAEKIREHWIFDDMDEDEYA